ncbi:MAG: amidohydrolase [Acidaminococcales bacterium]|jgi:5-methylthioadenosine/S-adenosylhomocysteine deaminase|nr:amidohydrolase [Acidaminococcales bacterium]
MPNILIKNVSMVDRPHKAHIGVTNDVISFVGEELPADFSPDITIDGEGKLAAPGFVNAHTHASMTLLRSYADDMRLMDWLKNKIWPAEATFDRNDIYWGAMLSIAEMLRSGTTTFADMYYFMDDVAKAVEETGIRAVLSRGLTGGDDSDGKSLAENEDLYHKWHNAADGRITVMFGPHAPYTCSGKFIKRIVAAAGRLGAGIHMHLSETADEVENCLKQNGKTPIAWMGELGLFELPTLAAHCVFATKEEIAIMRAKNVAVAHNPQSNLKLASGIAPVPDMLNAGVLVALGTDGASSNNNLDLLEEMRLVSILHKGVTGNPLVIPAREAFDMATINGAKALRIDNCGYLAAGAKADIVLFDIDKIHWHPKFNLCQLMVYAGQSADVDTVMVNGKILLEKGRLNTIDEEKVKYEVNKRVQKFAS